MAQTYFSLIAIKINIQQFSIYDLDRRNIDRSRYDCFRQVCKRAFFSLILCLFRKLSMYLEKNFREALLIIFDSVFLALGLASNLFVLFIMSRRKLIGKNISNFYIFHLAVTEVLYRIALTVLKIFNSTVESHLISKADCKAMTFWPKVTCAAVFVLLAGIAVDRKNHIINPLKNLGLVKHRSTRIVLIWVFSVAVAFPLIFGANLSPKRNNTAKINSSHSVSALSNCLLPGGTLLSKMSFTIYFLFAFIVPLSIITISYSKIFLYLRKRASRQNMSLCYVRSKRKALRMLVLVVVGVLLSWGPIMFSDLARVYGARFEVGDISVKKLTVSISLTSSVIHPVLYSFGNANFRFEVERAFRGCKTCKFPERS